MNFDTFCERVVQAMTDYMGKGVTVRIEQIRKNNGVLLNGLLVWREGCVITPTIYLEPYYQLLESDEYFSDVMQHIIKSYETYSECAVDVSSITEFACVKERITIRLINYKQNKELLGTVPHRKWLNLAITYHYEFEHPNIGSGLVLVRNSHMDMWKITENELYEMAIQNSERLLQDDLTSMCSFLEQLQPDFAEEINQYPELKMYILTNKNGSYGAATILYTDKLDKLSNHMKYNLFLIPSSIHEWIIIYDDGTKEIPYLLNMIREVNDTQLEKEQILSYSLYYYDRQEECVMLLSEKD